jgi:hypothetical protein
MFRMVLAAAMATAIFAGSAQAQTADAFAADTRCAMLGLSMAGAPNATDEQRQAGAMLSLYFVGKMHGRSPGIELRAAINQQASSLTPEVAQSESRRCSEEFRVLGQTLQALGQPATAPAPTP